MTSATRHLPESVAKPRAKARRLSLPREVRRAAQQLLAQQCWCWGRDARRAEGNLLLEYGFERRRPPAAEPGATIYSLDTPNAILRLWAFGFFWGEAGVESGRGVYVGRFEFAPLWWEGDQAPAAHAPPHLAPRHWPGLRAPRTLIERRETRRMLGAALREFARYEGWVCAGFGAPYRCGCLEAWGPKERFSPPDEVAARWGDLAVRIESFGAPPRRTAAFGHNSAHDFTHSAIAAETGFSAFRALTPAPCSADFAPLP